MEVYVAVVLVPVAIVLLSARVAAVLAPVAVVGIAVTGYFAAVVLVMGQIPVFLAVGAGGAVVRGGSGGWSGRRW